MELRDALMQISEIRQRIAGAQVFRGYRSATTAFSGLVAIGAAGAQSVWIPEPSAHVDAYLAIWIGAAVLSVAVIAGEMILRHRRSTSSLHRDITLMAVEQFVPCIAAGMLLTVVLRLFAPAVLWMLPGLWAILFSLGAFASRRMLPNGIWSVGGFYLLAGLLCLAYGQGARAFWPWAMGLTFGAGQLLVAAILYWKLERGHGHGG